MSLKSGISLASFVKNSPALSRFLTPVANAYAQAAGHRQVGLKYDDLIMEENDNVQKAIGRLSERESYDRAFRLRRAIQLSVIHRELPKEQWLNPAEDQRYLTPLVEEVNKEEDERAAWDTVKLEKKH
ncbi:Cytochrome b-c1 complex subunit 7 [Tilletia horrida]|uniref:Cytochrome b-c1 complex subunit 7 n=1 Tax=Tilletia horrida TaxID=155126 RepID=A0AAN6GAK8_9BASI|nr:Cytochrome b-c1 complex subunit 7 [Tilletia horrida]KAK0525646.1 Cytochrome b-c1 complex subunit 7 [Tilletia horrida]KAK0526913.1 Cytochrome b-c1 complex subunit 7 [Tilletia horrida]KAK0559443.1 Cytochrome b-c1 complex subunit 7 [Tilletia horrida]